MTQQEFFKRYKYDVVEDRIGGGGFGTVYKAYDTTWHREVAIKVSEVKVVNGKTFSLRDELEALAHVPEHPNIANYEKDKLFTFKMPNGVFDYAVMQYYPDGNLSNAIKQGLTAQQKEDIATQLLEGVAFLHEHKVVHRDLKPSNILIVRDGESIIPIITDFGLSKAAETGDGSVFTNSFGGGTPRYSSPEQLQGTPLRFNTDLWSYGAILYELFTGKQLFSASSGAANSAQADLEIYNKIVNGNVKSLGGMPETWRKVAEQCLVVDATKRAKSAGELLAIIKGDVDETEVYPPEPKDPPKNKKPLWIALALAAVAAIGILLFLMQPKPEPIPIPMDPDTEQFLSSRTLPELRSYLDDFGNNAKHRDEALRMIDSLVADSTANGHEYVDLGLPSGTLWATCNVGASKPEGYGNYYAWGETSTKSTYNWDTYRYANGNYDKLTKYCNKSDYGNNGFTDNLTTLQAGDDPARANWGGGWRTPSKTQWEELKDNTTQRWTKRNGTAGRLFTSKKNGRTLFLPAAGYRWVSKSVDVGSDGNYWSRSLYTDYPYHAWSLGFNSDGCTLYYIRSRSNGFSVRPVREN